MASTILIEGDSYGVQEPDRDEPKQQNRAKNARWGKRGGKGGHQGTTPRTRPTHFLALPLHTHAELKKRISIFQGALFDPSDLPSRGKATRFSSLVEGLDSSIVIDPNRLHMTLGVMSLDEDQPLDNTARGSEPPFASEPNPEQDHQCPPATPSSSPRRTVSSALELLRSLKFEISDILQEDKGVVVPLDAMDVLKTTRMPVHARSQPSRIFTESKEVGPKSHNEITSQTRIDTANREGVAVADRVGAGVLFVGPHSHTDTKKLVDVCDLIYNAFKREGYITDPRPLKLHCTVLNTSHRKAPRRIPFAYTDILASGACDILGSKAAYEPLSSQLNTLASDDAATARAAGSDEISESNTDVLPVLRTPPPASIQPESSTNMGLGDETFPSPPAPTNVVRKYRDPLPVPPPLKIDLGTYVVEEVQLWVMGSHGPGNEYMSCGGVKLE